MQFLSIVFCQECIFFVCILPKPLRFVHCILPKKPFFHIYILSRMRFCLYISCRNLHAFSIVFCSNAVFFPLYFGQNAFFGIYFAESILLFSVVFWGSRARLRAELASLSRIGILSRINILTYISMHTRRPEEWASSLNLCQYATIFGCGIYLLLMYFASITFLFRPLSQDVIFSLLFVSPNVPT